MKICHYGWFNRAEWPIARQERIDGISEEREEEEEESRLADFASRSRAIQSRHAILRRGNQATWQNVA